MKTFKCDCGFEWDEGKSRQHGCSGFYMEKVDKLQQENKALSKELEAVKAELDTALCKGYEIPTGGKMPNYHFTHVTIDKFNHIVSDAIKKAAVMPRWGGQPDDIPADFDGYCQAIYDVHVYADSLINKDG